MKRKLASSQSTKRQKLPRKRKLSFAQQDKQREQDEWVKDKVLKAKIWNELAEISALANRLPGIACQWGLLPQVYQTLISCLPDYVKLMLLYSAIKITLRRLGAGFDYGFQVYVLRKRNGTIEDRTILRFMGLYSFEGRVEYIFNFDFGPISLSVKCTPEAGKVVYREKHDDFTSPRTFSSLPEFTTRAKELLASVESKYTVL